MRRQRIALAALAALVALAGAGWLFFRPRQPDVVQAPPTPTLPPKPRLDYTPVPADQISPVVVQRVPERGAELPADGAVELVFDRPMDQASVNASFAVATAGGTDALAGTLEWVDTRTVRFKPAQALGRASTYDVVLKQDARAADGARLNGAYQFRFATAGYLEVGQTIPANEAAEVEAGGVITVMFNRPVVPLLTSGDQSALPQPLSFEPAIAGSGEWLNTSVYVFKPAAPLAGGTTYAARVDPKLADFDGNPIKEGGHSWTFSTIAPQVLYASPERDAKLVSVEPVISLTFNQPIARASAEQSFQLVGADGPVAGALQIIGETLVFTPGQQLKFDQRYEVVVAAGLQSLSGGAGMKDAWRQSFQTVPLPRIIRTEPGDGNRAAEPYNGFTIYFNAPINIDTVMANLSMTPAFSPTQVFTYFNTYDNSFVLNYDVKPSTDYRVQIGPNIADPYGNLTGQSLSVGYRTAALPPQVTLYAPSPVGVYSAALPARIGLSSVNQPTAALNLYSIDAEQLRKPQWEWNGIVPPSARKLRTWTEQLDTPLDERRLTAIDLVEGGGPLAPGAYAVTLDQPGSSQPQVHVMVVSELSITLKGGERDAMAWVTNSVTGEPVAGVEVEFSDNEGAALGAATTDAQGVAALKLKRTEDEGLVALIRQPFAAMSLNWSSFSPLWELGIDSSSSLPELTAHIYTERSIYRPGDQVRFKGIVRGEDDVRFSMPAVRQADVVVTDANGQELYRETRQLNANGAFDGELKLGAGAALGSYSLGVFASEASFYANFQVAAYRAPEFEVKVTPAAKEYVRGTASTAAVEVSYFFGGPVANVPIQWNIISSSHYFSPDWAERFDFGSQDDPWYCGRCWWREPEPTLPLLSGSGATDAQGRLVINLPAELKDSAGKPITNSLDLVIEATAAGKDNQVIAGRASAVVHRADFYVGLAARTYVAKAGEAQTIDVVTASAAGQRLPNQAVELEVFKVAWNNRYIAQPGGGGYWESDETRTSVARQSVTTDATASGAFSWTPAEAGSYQVVARGRDGAGREVRSATFVWVSGDTFAPWLRDNDDTVNLISDKTSYKPGETATILIPSPFQGPHLALISVERGGILSHEVRRLTSNSGVYQLALDASHAPNVYVSVVLLAPPAATGRAGAQVAEYKLGVLPLAVAPDPQTLNVKLTPAAAQALPGQELRYDVQVTDLAGAPVAAELSLDLVDKAVLSLAPRPDNAVLEAFYGRRPLGIATASTIALSAERFQEEFAEELERQADRDEEQKLRVRGQPPMEDGLAYSVGDTAAGAAPPAPAAASPMGEAAGRMDSNKSVAQQGAAPTIRGEFADTAFWQAVLATDASGRGSVTVKLPDNLTTWVMRGVAASADTRVGEGLAEVVATRPLLIRPVTPRFFVVDDQVELGANVSNNTDAPLAVEVSLAAKGLTLTSPATQTVTVPAKGEANVTWQVTALDAEQADLVFTAISGAYSDASRPRLATGPDGTLSVLRYSVPETVGTAGQLAEAGNRTEAIGLPKDIDTRNGELTVRIEPSLAAGLQDTLDYLDQTDYDSIEATISSFLPNVATHRALKQLGIANQELEAELPLQIEDSLAKLRLAQNQDGGWGWWAGDESNPHVSAYAVYGLIRARDSGWTVDEAMLARGMEYLTTQLADTASLDTPGEANRQAWLLYVLAEGGAPQQARQDELFQVRERLASYARALLALSLSKAGAVADDSRIKALLADFNNAAIVSATGAHWEEDGYDRWSMNTDTRSTAIILMALARLDPQNQLNPNVVRWLMVARQDGIWETSQESAWAVLALTDWMEVTGELDADYDYAAFINEKELGAGRFGKADVLKSVVLKVAVKDLLVEAGNRLTVSRGAGPGRAYYAAHLRAFLPVESVKALDRGVSVRRRYTLASCQDGPKCPAVESVKVGDVVRVDISVTAPNDLYYLQLEDPIPAGAEIVDTSLATTSVLEQAPGLSRNSPVPPVMPFDAAVPSARPAFDWYWGWWNWYSRSELRDDRVALFADYLPKGAYSYSYTFRATLPGSYHVIPTTAREAYFPEVYGRGDGQLMTIAK